MLKHRVHVAKRATDESASFGKSGQPKYEILGTFWMGETFNKGVKAMREGALDAYDTVMFRCRYIKQLDRWCLLKFKGKWYQITSFNDDYQDNQIQITATEMANQQVTIVNPPELKDIEIWGNSECTVRPSGNPVYVYAQFNTEVINDITLSNNDYKFSVHFDRTVRQVVFEEEWQSNEYNAGPSITAGSIIQLASIERTPSELTKPNFSFEIV
jgi:hypothetical protein